MRRDHPFPTVWLFTDERQGDGLWRALDRLPAGGGVILRHDTIVPAARLALARRLRRLTRARRQLLLVARDPRLARRVGADGVHLGRVDRVGAPAGLGLFGLVTAAARDAAGLVRARRAGAALIFLSPVFPTASHPHAPGLGPLRFGLLAGRARHPVAALGGLDPARARRLPRARAWGAIDAFTRSIDSGALGFLHAGNAIALHNCVHQDVGVEEDQRRSNRSL